MSILRQHIGERIRLFRESLGKNQREFSEMLKIKQQSLSKYENGALNLPDEVKIDFLKYGVNLSWLLTGKGAMTQEMPEQSEFNRKEDTKNSFFENTFPDVHKIWEENQQLKQQEGKGCEVCDVVHHLNPERTIKLKGYAEALLHEQEVEKIGEVNHRAG